MKSNILFFSVFVIFLSYAECAKILGVFPMAAYSHFALGNRLMKELANRGHEVTMISPFPQKPPVKNYRDLLLEGFMEEAETMKVDLFKMETMTFMEQISFTDNFSVMVTERTLEHPVVQTLLKSGEKFDLVIIEQFLNEAHRGFQHAFKAPCIMFSTVGSSSWTNHLVGNPSMPSYIPEIFSPFSGHMTLKERAINLATRIFSDLYTHLHSFKVQNDILHKHFPDAPHIYDLMYNTSLILLNSHSSTNQPVPHGPNMIEIGGFHVNPPKKLPEDLQKYLDGAKEGVVYFSMGSNLKSSELPVEKRDAILESFRKLKLKVLWKWEEENLPGQPPNVKTGKWLPQQDILAHPNIKLFITHGGLLSTIEAIYHGVPVVGIPIFGDQKINMQNAVNNGYGIAVPYQELTEESLTSALNTMLSDTRYRDNAKKRSAIMHDQPIKPLDSAVFWVEHVLRHKGADHFRSTALDLTWYQYLMLDILVLVEAALLLPLVLIYFAYKKLCGGKCNPSKDDQKKKMKAKKEK